MSYPKGWLPGRKGCYSGACDSKCQSGKGPFFCRGIEMIRRQGAGSGGKLTGLDGVTAEG